MINVNEELLDELNDSEYYLISKLMKYGKKSCPRNEVLLKITNWGDNKLKKYKKSLIDKGFLISTKRWKVENGKRVRDSNQYTVNTKLISKYRGKNKSEQYEFHTVQIHTDENEPYEIQPYDFELYENDHGIKVLKLLIIDNNKLLKEGSEKTTSLNKIPSDLKKGKKEKPKKVAPKKGNEKHTFPDNTPAKSFDPLAELDQRINKQLPFDVVSASATMELLFPEKEIALLQYNKIYSEKATLDVIEKSWKTFIEKRFSNSFSQVRAVSILKKCFFEWTKNQVKYQRNDKNKLRKTGGSSSLIMDQSEDLSHRNTWMND